MISMEVMKILYMEEMKILVQSDVKPQPFDFKSTMLSRAKHLISYQNSTRKHLRVNTE